LHVLGITASTSLSNHILIAPEAPAPKAIDKIETKAIKGCISPGARIKPTNAVKTTRYITLGLRRAK
jgi:hypothetical protein